VHILGHRGSAAWREGKIGGQPTQLFIGSALRDAVVIKTDAALGQRKGKWLEPWLTLW